MSLLKSLSQNKYVGKLVSGFVSNRVNKEVETISEHFARFLESRIATTEEETKEVFQIRHSVYCEELKFESERPEYRKYKHLFSSSKALAEFRPGLHSGLCCPPKAAKFHPSSKCCSPCHRNWPNVSVTGASARAISHRRIAV